jgi:hypothetical protein
MSNAAGGIEAAGFIGVTAQPARRKPIRNRSGDQGPKEHPAKKFPGQHQGDTRGRRAQRLADSDFPCPLFGQERDQPE